MPLEIIPTEIPEVLEIKSPVYTDDRGYFTESHNAKTWAKQGFTETFVQDNLSLSAKGTLRGMHYQIAPHGMGKLVRAVRGSVFDAAVDLRRESATFGKWVGRTLSAENNVALWVPVGFAHGFLALEDQSLVYYKCTGVYTPAAERSLVYSDEAVGIKWPFEPTLVTPKDADAPLLQDAVLFGSSTE